MKDMPQAPYFPLSLWERDGVRERFGVRRHFTPLARGASPLEG